MGRGYPEERAYFLAAAAAGRYAALAVPVPPDADGATDDITGNTTDAATTDAATTDAATTDATDAAAGPDPAAGA
jgi:hypothetical protein